MTDFDPEDTFSLPFEDDLAAGLSGGAFDPEMLGALDGAIADAFAQRKARLTQVLLDGETGVVFESLALFAEPLFTLYELDPSDAFRLRSEPDQVGDDIVALLETARILWAFLSMPRPERAHKRQALAAQLVGEEPTDEDWVSLDGLIEAAEIHWRALLPEEIKAAETTRYPTLTFDGLLQHPAFRIGADADDPSHSGYGSTGLSELEARALFSQPLLDAPETMTDGDAFEAALLRADALWLIAQHPTGDLPALVHSFAREHGTSPEHIQRLEQEAHMMVDRYRALFPEHGNVG